VAEYIKREDALAYQICEARDWYVIPVIDVEAIPAADVRKNLRAEWFADSNDIIRCSKCREQALRQLFYEPRFPFLVPKTVRSNYCPNCGADMRGKEDGE